jgi:hypothetical protein
MTEKRKTRIMKASYMLQSKVGMGPVDEDAIKRSQEVMDGNSVDFGPMATEFLNELKEAVEKAKAGEDTPENLIKGMTGPVMQLKANAGMFKATLIGNLANIMLNFLESIDALDNDVIDIVNAHHTTLNLIISSSIEGDGGAYGAQFEKELKDACKRYFAKRGSDKAGNAAGFFD